MYRKNSNSISNRQDLSNYIEDRDIYNSVLLEKLSSSSIERTNYLITTKEYRPDLIAKEIYGDTKYTGLLVLTQGCGLDGFYKGAVLRVIPKNTLDSIIGSVLM